MGNNSVPFYKNNFFIRLGSSVILLPIVIWATCGGGFLYFILLLVAAYIAGAEYSNMCGRWSFGLDTMGLITFLGCAVTTAYMHHLKVTIIFIVAGGYITYLLVKLRKNSETHLKEVIPSYINRPILMAVGTIYLGAGFASFAYLHNYDHYNLTTLWVFGLVVCSDISAYVCGNLIKGAKLAPKISPGKTWSGLIGAIIITFVFSYIAANYFNLPHLLDVSLFGAVTVIVAHVGDLLESALKRYVKMKDSGTIMPGHGGLLDRIDALLLVGIFSCGVCMVMGKSLLFI